MSNLLDGLVLFYGLDEISDGHVVDLSGRGHPGEVKGNPKLVGDATFGYCLSFDGEGDAVIVPGAAVPAGPRMTLSVWLFGADVLPKANSVFYARDAKGNRTANVHLPWTDRQVYFDCGNDGPSYDRVSGLVSADSDFKGAWTHWAFTKDATTGQMTIYRDCVRWQSNINMVRPMQASASAWLGSGPDLSWGYAGRIAHLRLYDRVLSADEIARLKAEDQAALASFRRTFPIDFSLRNDDDEPVLAIDDGTGGYRMRLGVTNASDRVITFGPADGPQATSGNHHFAVQFRPSILSPSFDSNVKTLLKDALANVGWAAAVETLPDRTATLYLLGKPGTTLRPNESARIALPGMSADGLGGARRTQVEVSYRNLNYPNDPKPIEGHRSLHLSVLNRSGLATIPLRVDFNGTDTILNDGKWANDLALHVHNLKDDGPIVLNSSRGSSTPSRFILSFEVKEESQDSALGTSSQVAAINVKAEDATNWHVVPKMEGITPVWIMTTEKSSLGPGEAVRFSLSNIISSLPSGPTTLYLDYENIPGYSEGHVAATIHKSPLLSRGPDGSTINIGRPNAAYDDRKLAVSASANHVQIRREATETAGGPVMFLELIQDDPKAPAHVPEVHPFIRFHHNNRFWHRIEARADGFYLKDGWEKSETDVALHAGAGTFSGQVFAGGGLMLDAKTGIKRGIDFTFKSSQIDFFGKTSDAIRINGLNAGVLAAKDQDVMIWDYGDAFSKPGPATGIVLVKGMLHAVDKRFLIDHPLSPDHHLIHACLEGPESAVYYRGVGRLREGRATVRLPEYFEALTRKDGRTVQLTPVGREPFLLSYEPVEDGAFRVHGTNADGEFSWELKAVRADVEPLRVEVAKG